MAAPDDVVSHPESAAPSTTRGVGSNKKPLMTAGLILGIGQAGFFDGIVFHQLLQWHYMFTSVKTDVTLAGLKLNTLGDGLFHVFDWAQKQLQRQS